MLDEAPRPAPPDGRAKRMALAYAGAVVIIALVPALAAQGCGGTTVFDAPDPKACGSGHGCPMAGCVCDDDSVFLDTTCELGECRATADVCAERCEGFGGVRSTFESQNDEVPLPNCELLCSRLLVNGCELGCSTLFTECLVPTNCSQDAGEFWGCATERGVISCLDNAVRIEGCAPKASVMCE